METIRRFHRPHPKRERRSEYPPNSEFDKDQDKDNAAGKENKRDENEMKNAQLPSSPEKDKLPETPGMEKPQPKPQPEGDKPVPVATQKESKEEKERREARAILMERRDIEPGCPVPQRSPEIPPDKDY